MTAQPIHVAAAGVTDAYALAKLNERTWTSAYGGVLPEPALRQGILATGGWRDVLTRGGHGERDDRERYDRQVFLARCGGDAVGFVWCGAGRDDSAPWTGEVYMLHVLPEWQRRGVGGALFAAAARHVFARGLFELGMWCVAQNQPGRAYCATIGADERAQRSVIMGGARVQLVGLAWPNTKAVCEFALGQGARPAR